MNIYIEQRQFGGCKGDATRKSGRRRPFKWLFDPATVEVPHAAEGIPMHRKGGSGMYMKA